MPELDFGTQRENELITWLQVVQQLIPDSQCASETHSEYMLCTEQDVCFLHDCGGVSHPTDFDFRKFILRDVHSIHEVERWKARFESAGYQFPSAYRTALHIGIDEATVYAIEAIERELKALQPTAMASRVRRSCLRKKQRSASPCP